MAHGVDPPCRPIPRLTLKASTASRPTSVTIASAPLGGGTAGVLPVIWGCGEAEYFLLKILTRMSRRVASDLPVGQNWRFVRRQRRFTLGSELPNPPPLFTVRSKTIVHRSDVR